MACPCEGCVLCKVQLLYTGSSGVCLHAWAQSLARTAADRLHEAGAGGTRGHPAGTSLEGAVMECCTGPDAAATARPKVDVLPALS